MFPDLVTTLYKFPVENMDHIQKIRNQTTLDFLTLEFSEYPSELGKRVKVK